MLRGTGLMLSALLALGAGAGPQPGGSDTWTWARAPHARGERQQLVARGSGVRVNALAAANDGGVFVAGTAWGEIAIAPGIAFHDPIGNRANLEHAFLLRLDGIGRTVWAKDLGFRIMVGLPYSPPGGVTALAVKADGTLIAAGAFTVDADRSRQTAVSLARFTPEGKVLWATDALKPVIVWERDSRAQSLFVADDGDIFVTGCDHSVGPDFGLPATKAEIPLPAATWPDNGFVARITPWGAPRWTYHLEPGGGRSDMFTCGTSVVPDGAGGFYLGATYVYAGSNPSAAAEKAQLPKKGSFVARMDGNGKELWSQTLGDEAHPVSLAALSAGRVAVSGRFAPSDPTSRGLDVFTCVPGLAVLDPSGHREWTILHEGHRYYPDPMVPPIAARANRILWAAYLPGGAAFGPVASGAGAGRTVVAVFGANGQASPSYSSPNDGFGEPARISVGAATWIGGRTGAPLGTAAFVQRLPAPF